MENVVCIIQARLAARRLPGKVLLPLAGKTVLERVVERVQSSQFISRIVLAIPFGSPDSPLVVAAKRLAVQPGRYPVDVIQGPEHDCLERYYLAARAFQAQVVVRVTADCPLVDPELMDEMIIRLEQGDYDYVRLGKGAPLGIASEVFAFEAFERAREEAHEPHEREHVTVCFYEVPGRFCVSYVQVPDPLNGTGFRLTLDTSEDYSLLRAIYENCPSDDEIVDLRQVVAYLKSHPRVAQLNAGVRQKHYRESDSRFKVKAGT